MTGRFHFITNASNAINLDASKNEALRQKQRTGHEFYVIHPASNPTIGKRKTTEETGPLLCVVSQEMAEDVYPEYVVLYSTESEN